MSNWVYTVTHYDINTTTTTNITDDVVSIPMFTDVGSGEVNSARLVLSVGDGKFIKTAPLLDEYDRIRINVVDNIAGGSNTYDKVFDIIKIVPSESKSQGTRLTLFLLGMEHHLQKINYVKPHYFEGAQEVIEDIGNSYNNSRGTLQPVLDGHLTTDSTNELPTANFQNNIYDYGINEENCYDRMNETTDKLGSSVDAGGALDFFDTKFDSNVGNFTALTYKGFSSGSPSVGSEVTISDSTSVNVGETEGGIDNTTGSNVLAWGSVDQGSLPVDFSRFKSAERRYILYPIWASDEEYKVGAVVLYLIDGLVYERENTDVVLPATAPDADANWVQKPREDKYGDLIQYSPWTDDKVTLWKNGGCDPTDINSSAEIGPGFFDGNVVVQDVATNVFQTWANIRVSGASAQPSDITGDSVLNKWLYNDTDFYRGFRVLIDSDTVSGDFTGFANHIVQYDGTTWKSLYSPINNLQVAIHHEGIKYEFQVGTTDWVGLNASTDADCYHPYTSLLSAIGPPVESRDDFTVTNVFSAILARYDFSAVLPSATNAHQAGGWLQWSIPFPLSTHNAISEDVGQIYGGKIQSGGVPDSDKEPATIDIQNMHLTHDGFRGFNAPGTPSASIDLGQISSLDFWMKMDYQAQIPATSFVTLSEANFKMRCLIYDTSDNVVFQDFTIPFNDHWDEYRLPISGFQIYRARKPLTSSLDTLVIPKGLDVQNIFLWRNVKYIVWQTQESYESQGRYTNNPFLQNRYMQLGVNVSGFPLAITHTDRRVDLYIDAFHFTKPLLVQSGSQTTRNIEPTFLQKPEIGDYDQLLNDAKAELEKTQFRHVEYDISTTGALDVNFGDFLKYKHPRLISDELRSGTDGGVNFITLVAKRIEYSITKPKNGKGGFLRRIHGVRRFV